MYKFYPEHGLLPQDGDEQNAATGRCPLYPSTAIGIAVALLSDAFDAADVIYVKFCNIQCRVLFFIIIRNGLEPRPVKNIVHTKKRESPGSSSVWMAISALHAVRAFK